MLSYEDFKLLFGTIFAHENRTNNTFVPVTSNFLFLLARNRTLAADLRLKMSYSLAFLSFYFLSVIFCSFLFDLAQFLKHLFFCSFL